MGMTKSESKYFNTAKLMETALVELLETKSLEYISVKEICKKAGVNRSTFYLHYENVADLLGEAVEHINSDFIASFGDSAKEFVGKINDSPFSELVLVNDFFLAPYLKFIYENQSIFRASFSNPKDMGAENAYSFLQRYVLKPILERFHIPQEVQGYWTGYYVGGITAVIREWLGRNCRESEEQIKQIIIDCVRSENALLNKMFGE